MFECRHAIYEHTTYMSTKAHLGLRSIYAKSQMYMYGFDEILSDYEWSWAYVWISFHWEGLEIYEQYNEFRWFYKNVTGPWMQCCW